MTAQDILGLTLSGADAASAQLFDAGVADLQRFVGDPVGKAEAAIAAKPDFAMAHVLKGWLYGLSTEASATAATREAARSAQLWACTERERTHAAALGALVEGRWHEAGRLLGEWSAAEPRDALALQAGHQIDFFTGNAPMLRDRVAAALPAWDQAMPGFHAVLGMHAFGLEECGDYGSAERAGREAVRLEPRDGWAQHAVAHVMEMQGRLDEGISWMRGNERGWTEESFLQVHNWWHLALFHYELGQADEVLALYDAPIHGQRSSFVLNLVDASALLWRLHLNGADVGDRWQALAEDWEPKARAGNYAFNDAHAMMAFVGAGREDAAEALLDAQRRAMAGEGDNALFTSAVGHPLSLAIRAFGRGDHSEAVRLILPIREKAHLFGGSHAQRDVVELTLLEAALRGGQWELARRLAVTRREAKPRSALAALFASRAAASARPANAF
ncbi:MAG TPA: tetratricopeptide repeat protein [Mesorhizobium sp.]|jgi:tetratricopeptide (TPR) repeat protein|nr:tetratricopeptide repeat protein [Mesorhizobium sp.]